MSEQAPQAIVERTLISELKDFLLLLNQSGVLTGEDRLRKQLASLMEKHYKDCEAALGREVEPTAWLIECEYLKSQTISRKDGIVDNWVSWSDVSVDPNFRPYGYHLRNERVTPLGPISLKAEPEQKAARHP